MANFRQKLADAAASAGGNSSKDVLLINMQSKKNYGSIVFVPYVTGDKDSVAVLNNVMEVGYVREGTYKDEGGKEQKFKNAAWYRLLNLEDYPDLSSEEVDIYKHLRSMGSKLNGHKFSKNTTQDRQERNKRIRFKDYVLISAYVIEHRDKDGKKLHEKVPAVIAFSSKTFMQEFNKALKAKDDKAGGSTEWQMKLFNDKVKRKKYLQVSYALSDNPKKIGYIVSVSIEDFNDETIRYTGGNGDKGYDLDLTSQKEKLDQLTDPINKFLGKNGRYFNRKEIDGLTERLHELMNKYCGGNYPLAEGKTVAAVPVKDPMDGIEEKKKDLPPTDEERKTGTDDNWD